MYYIFNIVITTILIILITEIFKRSTLAGSILASIPLVSILSLFKKGMEFYTSMGIAVTLTVFSYCLMVLLAQKFGIKL